MDHSPIDFTELLTGRMRENPLWQDLFASVSAHIQNHVTLPRREIQTIRDSEHVHRDDAYIVPAEDSPDGSERKGRVEKIIIHQPKPGGEIPQDCVIVDVEGIGEVEVPVTAMQDRNWLIRNAQMLGFDFFSSELTTQDYYRIAKFVALYWPEGGNERFVNFLGFVKNIRFDLVKLWSKDTNPQVEDVEYDGLEDFKPGMIPIWDNGEWYPTSHVELRYDGEEYSRADLGDVRALFYALAPIHIVLQRITAAVYGDWEVFTALAAQYRHIYQSSARWQWDDGHTVISHAYGGAPSDLQMANYEFKWRVVGEFSIVVPKAAAVQSAEHGELRWKSPGLLDIRMPQTGGVSGMTQAGKDGKIGQRGDFQMYHPPVGGRVESAYQTVQRPKHWFNENVNLGAHSEVGSANVMSSGAIYTELTLLGIFWYYALVLSDHWLQTAVCSVRNNIQDGTYGTGTTCSVDMSVRALYQGSYRHPVTN